MNDPPTRAMPRVLHVMAGGSVGGAETMCADTVTALSEAGVEQAIVTRPNRYRDQTWQDNDVPLYYSRFPRHFGFRTRAVIDVATQEFRPTVRQFWMARAASYAPTDGIPNIGWFGGYYDLKYYRNCPYRIGVTTDIADHIVAAGGDPAHTVAIHTFADLVSAMPVDRSVLDTPPDRPVLLALARLHWKKGLDTLIRALIEVPAAVLWIAGDGPLRARLTRLAQRCEVADRVRFLGWRTDRAALLAACDICVFPSRYEPFGTVMPEAWASGVPLVAAAAQGPRAYVEPERNGLLVPTDDPAALAAAINRVLNDGELRARLIAGGHATYAEKFTKRVMVNDYLAFYRHVLDHAGAAGLGVDGGVGPAAG